MKHMSKIIFVVLMYLGIVFSFSYAQQTAITDLIDQFKQATDLQRQQITGEYTTKEISGSGRVNNVEEYNFFNQNLDVVKKYYKVTTEEQKTKQNTPFQVIFLYKDKDKVQDIPKGQLLTKDGSIIKIIDERLLISVWLFVGELNPQDKELLIQ